MVWLTVMGVVRTLKLEGGGAIFFYQHIEMDLLKITYRGNAKICTNQHSHGRDD